MFKKINLLLLVLLFSSACASDNDIFPNNPFSLDVDEVALPNPIAILADPANDQIVVFNSNIDIVFGEASVVTINIDATDPDNPILTPTSARQIPNYAGSAIFDGTNAYVTYRQAGEGGDILEKYTISEALVEDAISGVTQNNPFGLDFYGTDVVVVCDKEVEVFDSDLVSLDLIDLTTPSSDTDIDDVASKRVENVAVDQANDRAYVSNRDGKMFVIDLLTSTVTHVIDGPANSRGIATDGNYIYVVDGDRPSLWVLDPDLLPAVTEAPEEVDDSLVVVKQISLGRDPNGITLDLVQNRAYIANAIDRSVSIISLTLQEEIARISLDDDDTDLDRIDDPFTIAAGNFDGVNLVFIANFNTDNISVMNADTFEVLQVFPAD